MVSWIGISLSKYFYWRKNYSKPNSHNGSLPKSHWLDEWEKAAIVSFARKHPETGYRRLAYHMMDEDVVAVSPESVYRVLKSAEVIGNRPKSGASRKGKGFEQPKLAHEHWHIDISYINICGTFYYLCTLLDGYSRYILHWELKKQMTEQDVEIVLQRAREKYPKARSRIISDNGPQFIAKEFKEYIRICEMTHVRTSPYYPQSNGKIERWHKSLKEESLRRQTPLSLEDGRRVVGKYVEEYNGRRLHSAIGYVTPEAKLAGREGEIINERKKKLEAARAARKERWEQAQAETRDLNLEAKEAVQEVILHQVKPLRPEVQNSNSR